MIGFSLSDIQSEIDQLIALYNQLKTDDGKISLSDAWQIFQVAIEDLSNLADELNVPSADKKAIILDALSQVFDKVIAGIELNYVPRLLIPVVDKVLKQIFLSLATGVLNKIFPDALKLVYKPQD